MKSKIFLCLLLIVAILAFGACGNKDNAAGKMEHAVDDVADGIDDFIPCYFLDFLIAFCFLSLAYRKRFLSKPQGFLFRKERKQLAKYPLVISIQPFLFLQGQKLRKNGLPIKRHEGQCFKGKHPLLLRRPTQKKRFQTNSETVFKINPGLV